MAFNLLTFIDETVLHFFDIRLTPQARKATSVFVVGGLAVLMTILFWWVYSGYAGQQEKNAQKTLASCIELYEQAAGAKASSTPWSTVQAACQRGHETYEKSVLAPYFLAYQSEALIKENKIDEAITVMNRMMNAMSQNSPLYYLYATKLSLMEMDAADSAVQAQGLKRLEELAANTNNEQRDEALYYAGLYYWHHDDRAKAKEAWQKIDDIPGKNQEYDSPWKQLVSERLAMIA